jgi:hypothetical protein
MTLPKVSQYVTLVLADSPTQPAKVSQLPVMVLSGPPNTPSNVTQFVLLAAISNARGYISLRDPISLNCWQPCTQYGTYSTIIYLGN